MERSGPQVSMSSGLVLSLLHHQGQLYCEAQSKWRGHSLECCSRLQAGTALLFFRPQGQLSHLRGQGSLSCPHHHKADEGQDQFSLLLQPVKGQLCTDQSSLPLVQSRTLNINTNLGCIRAIRVEVDGLSLVVLS